MSEFIKELEDDIKEEQLVNLWKKYGPYVIGTAAGIVLVAGGIPMYKNYQASQSIKASGIYKQALRYVETGRDDKALELFDQLISDHSGYGKLAKLQKAALLTDTAMKEGKITLMDEVQKQYQTLAAQNSKDPSLKGLAIILEAYRAVSMGESGKWETQIQPLTAPNHPWRSLAIEVLALKDMKEGRMMEAAERLGDIVKEKKSSQVARSRAMLMLSSMQSLVEVPSPPQ